MLSWVAIPGESDVGDGVAVSVDGSATMSVVVGVGIGTTADVGVAVNKVTADVITCKIV